MRLRVELDGYLVDDPKEIEVNDNTAPGPCAIADVMWAREGKEQQGYFNIRLFVTGHKANRLLKAGKDDHIEATGTISSQWMVDDGSHCLHPEILAISATAAEKR